MLVMFDSYFTVIRYELLKMMKVRSANALFYSSPHPVKIELTSSSVADINFRVSSDNAIASGKRCSSMPAHRLRAN